MKGFYVITRDEETAKELAKWYNQVPTSSDVFVFVNNKNVNFQSTKIDRSKVFYTDIFYG